MDKIKDEYIAMNLNNKLRTERIELVDALRGFALLAIVLIHNVEHYNVMGSPADAPDWLCSLDSMISHAVFLIIGGKAYAIFSFMFGLSFYIQMRNARKRGSDYRMRWIWRMVLLALFAQVHAMFYNGDILLFYAVCGLILIPASGWSDRAVLIVACVLMIQPWALYKISYSIVHPDYVDVDKMFMTYYYRVADVAREGNLIEMIKSNLGDGQLYSNLWQIESGRLFQAPALFLFGMYAGRHDLFEHTDVNATLWRRACLYGILAAIPFYMLSTFTPELIVNDTIRAYYAMIISMLFNFALATVLVSAFTILWFGMDSRGCRWQRMLIPYGRMSLTNYIVQSVIGVSVYYHYGLGLYDKVGTTLSVAIGLGIFSIQLAFSYIWLRSHRQGPFEYIWKRLTWLDYSSGGVTSASR